MVIRRVVGVEAAADETAVDPIPGFGAKVRVEEGRMATALPGTCTFKPGRTEEPARPLPIMVPTV